MAQSDCSAQQLNFTRTETLIVWAVLLLECVIWATLTPWIETVGVFCVASCDELVMTASSFCHWPISHVVWAGLQCGVCLLWTSLAQLKIYGYGGQCAVMAYLLLVLRGLHNILHSVILSIIKASILFPCWSLLLFTDIFLTSQFIHNLPRNNWCSPRHMPSVYYEHWKFSTFPFTYCPHQR